MAEEIPFDEFFDHRQLDSGCRDHQEVSESEVNDNFQLRRDQKSSNVDENSAAKTSYLGTRRDRNGKWVRRHCSEKRYPRMAGKVNSSSPLPSPSDRGSSSEFSPHENEGKGRPSTSPRQQRRQQQKYNQKQQQQQQQMQMQQEQQLSSRQSDHSQHQPLHIEQERRTDPEEIHPYIHNAVIHKNHIARPAQAFKQEVPSVSDPKTRQIKTPSQFKHEIHVLEAPTTTGRRQTKQKKHKLVFDVSSFQSNQNDGEAAASCVGDEISGMFTTNSKMTSATRQNSLGSEINNNDEERIRRFGDAYNAIMLAHQANEVKPSEPRPSYSGKRWTRDPNIVSAMSIDGRSYIDLQRTPTLSLKQMMTSPDVYDSNKGMLNVELHDRKASWLVHMPRTSSKYSSEKERALFQVKEESTINEEESSSPNRKETTTEKILPLTPCLRKLNDIETKIQAIEIGRKFDLEENRRAIVHAGLPPRQKLMGQRGGASSVIRRFNQLSIEEEPTAEEEQKAATLSRSYDTNSTEAKAMDDNNSGIDSTPIVRTSTLRLLFSGKPEEKQMDDSKESTNAVRIENKTHLTRTCLKSSFSTSNDGQTFNQIEEGKSNENITPRNQLNGRLSTSNKEAEAPQNLKSVLHDQYNLSDRTTSRNGYSFNKVEEGKGKSVPNIPPLRLDPSVHRPDPPDSVNQNLNKASSSFQREELAPQLNVANLVRASLVVHARSFIDTDENLDDFDEEEEQTITRSMSMSPSLITKRYQQVLGAIEAKNWQQVSYLTHANPWLMEMKDVRNDQYLLHSLALYSGGQTDGDISSDQSIQEEIVFNILEYEPGVVHRLDTEGYLPLHMAAASGNIMMIKVLGEKFPAAASVQNHDGLLPLHLAVMSCALYATGEHAVDLILNLFPTGVAVKDNDGNTPLHTASGALRGDVGVSIISRLLQVHEDILTRYPSFLKKSMVQPKVPKHFDEASVVTLDDDEEYFLSMMKNNRGETPLIRAIKSRAGRQVVDVLLGADGGSLAALDENSSGASALHLILREEFYDAAVAISILKSAPSTAAIRDVNRILPIQLACANALQREIILAIAIIDLPIDLGSKEDVILRNGFGSSWWFLLCESNDEYVDIVTEILALCSHPQKMALCLTIAGSSNGNEEAAVACATPLCKSALRESLRFLGRFEFDDSGYQNNFAYSGKVQYFDAIDYGPVNNPSTAGKKVSLICYGSNEVYLKEAKHLQESKLDMKFYEEFEYFDIGDVDDANIPSGAKLCHCVAVVKSKLSFFRVVAGMPRNHEYRANLNLLERYFSKVKSIMFRVGEGIYNLHACNIIHGQIDSHSIMKFGDRWKITRLCGSVIRGGPFSISRLGAHSPPEAFVRSHQESSSTSQNPSLVAEPSVDIWAFGKLVYEAFVGESMFAPLVNDDDEDLQYRCIAGWNDRYVKILTKRLSESGIGALGIDLVYNCLQMEPNTRPQSMAQILQHEFWKEKH